MRKTQSPHRNSAIDFAALSRRSGRGNVPANMHAAASHQPLRKHGEKTILYLAIEADDVDVLDMIRAALPQGSRLHVRFAKTAPSMPGYTASEDPSAIRLPELTARQRGILDLLAEGLSNKEIGRKLSLSHFTVRNHIAQLMRRLGASTRQEVVARITGAEFGACPDAGLSAR